MSGSAIGLPASACSIVITLRMCASGFFAPFSWFFTATAASCSRVVPYWYICRRAIMANSAGNVAPGAHFAAQIARARQNLGDLRRRLRGHLLDARHQHDVVQPRRNRRHGVEERRSAGRAGRFETRRGNAM